jgi:hypothetical protein
VHLAGSWKQSNDLEYDGIDIHRNFTQIEERFGEGLDYAERSGRGQERHDERDPRFDGDALLYRPRSREWSWPLARGHSKPPRYINVWMLRR